MIICKDIVTVILVVCDFSKKKQQKKTNKHLKTIMIWVLPGSLSLCIWRIWFVGQGISATPHCSIYNSMLYDTFYLYLLQLRHIAPPHIAYFDIIESTYSVCSLNIEQVLEVDHTKATWGGSFSWEFFFHTKLKPRILPCWKPEHFHK